jgi:glycosyltransferase involved in cell wall biosynthesis
MVSEKSKIMHLITTLHTGGSEMQLAKLLSSTNHARFKHCVVSLVNEGVVGKMIRNHDIAVYSLGMKRGLPSPAAVWKLWKLVRCERPVILQTWLYHADLLGLLVGKLARVPVLVWNVRCSLVDMRQYSILSRVVLKVLCLLSFLPDVVVANSKTGRQHHIELGYSPRRFEIISNGIDTERFHPDRDARQWLRDELHLPASAITIGLIARYDPMKDHSTFLAAAAEVHRKYPNAYFILCGKDVDARNKNLLGSITDLELLPHVRLMGIREDVHRITAAFDIACSSSCFGEGFCNAIGEAMACGVPCVATDIGDARDIVGDTGTIVPPGDVRAFANALIDFISLGPKGRTTIGLEARTRIVHHFDVTAMAARYEHLYLSLSDAASGSSSRIHAHNANAN